MAKTMRRDAGTGSLYQRADGMWVGSITLPERAGKRRRKTVSSKTKSGAQAKLRELRKELDRAGDLETSSPTLTQWLDTWMKEIAFNQLKPRTFNGYRIYIEKHIKPEIGKTRLDKLTPTHVRRLHQRFSDLGLSSTTALQAHNILSKALTAAMQEGKISRNPADLVDRPRKAVSTRKALTADEARTLLLSVASDERQAIQWAIALFAGLRQSERLGLTREMIDLDRRTITVAWGLHRLKWQHGCGGECSVKRAGSCPSRAMPIPDGMEAKQAYGGLWLLRPKSRAGWREVPIAPALHALLTAYFDAYEPGDEGIAFPRADGHPVDPRDDSKAWAVALEAAGLPHVPLHSARHTTATLLFELGIDERTRVAILGHSSATVTAGYTHVTDSIAQSAMQRLDDLLRPQQIGG